MTGGKYWDDTFGMLGSDLGAYIAGIRCRISLCLHVTIDEVSENIGRMGRNNFLLKQIIRGGANTRNNTLQWAQPLETTMKDVATLYWTSYSNLIYSSENAICLLQTCITYLQNYNKYQTSPVPPQWTLSSCNLYISHIEVLNLVLAWSTVIQPEHIPPWNQQLDYKMLLTLCNHLHSLNKTVFTHIPYHFPYPNPCVPSY